MRSQLAQLDNARRIAPHLADGQVIFFAPGTFGSYVVAEAVRQAGNRAELAYAETGTLPWLTRKHGPTTCAITARATRLPTGVYPARHSERARAVYSRALASLPRCDRRTQRPGLMMAGIYRALLDEIARDGYRVLDRRAGLTPLRKAWIAWKTCAV